MTTATVVVGSSRSQRLVLSSGERTWTVLGEDHRMVEPAQEYLEYLRAQQASPNTVKSYARALALWWQYLDAFGLRWDAVTLADFGAFLTWVDWYNNRRLHGACGGWYVALVVMRRVVVQSDGASEAGADNCRRPRVVVGGRWSE